jgi:hypothetical protein
MQNKEMLTNSGYWGNLTWIIPQKKQHDEKQKLRNNVSIPTKTPLR